jgi:Domain of unknown function (DUF4115)/Metallo-beta-lactamase superfamily
VVRLFAATPVEVLRTPPPVPQGPVRVHSAYSAAGRLGPVARRLPITLVAAHAGSHVVVRSGSGEVVFAGDLVLGEKKALHVVPPVNVQAGNAGAVEVQVRGKDKGVLGQLDQPGRRTFGSTSR